MRRLAFVLPYTSRAPGHAGCYFYGYKRLLQLRVEAELSLGSRFDRLAFNNFVIDQGLLPPGLLAKAVRQDFLSGPRRSGEHEARVDRVEPVGTPGPG